MAIYFSRINDKYGCFSNFAHYNFELDGKKWMTSEHYFQAQKFYGTEYEEIIRLLDNPMKAAEMGRNRDLPLREDWEQIKDNIMRKAVCAKFTQNLDIKDILISTGRENIIEKTTNDYYWGCGKDGSGKNMLGIILMEVREKLLSF
ncbi:MAG: NADAR family protein [Lachnospiraceae bacterium]|nr:NADAR family protein [Lachnospiraceae bacterium]